MPTIKEKSEEKFVGDEYEERLTEAGVGKYTTKEYVAYINQRIAMGQTPPFVAYAHAIKSRDEVENKLRAVTCERDKLNKSIRSLEADLEAANFAVTALGSTEVP
jgi:hypothetical protein